MAAKCIAQHVSKNCFVGRLNVGLHSNGPLSNGTLVHLLKVVDGLLEGNYGQALGLESEILDDALINDVNNESTESDVGPEQDAPTAASGSKQLSAGIKAAITLLCLVVAGLVAVLAIGHFRQPVTKEVADEEEESEIHDTMAVTTDQHDEIYGA
jgi:hypothetical protein